ncbi:MAG: PIN domain-containing protein [Armatimonadetes bacterium]|nr:PIN domain-containing protein [Armatimonadota bacterium]
MYLLDTNLLLEVLLAQERAEEVKQFLQTAPREHLFLSDFALYSVGIQTFRRGAPDAFVRMVEDLILQGGIRLAHLSAAEMRQVSEFAQRFGLDFDDAYQYTLARREGWRVVSFDADFDRTDAGRLTPAQALEELRRGGLG